jgi:hypothetical protein
VRHARCCKACLPEAQGPHMRAVQYHSTIDDCDFCGDVPESEVLFTIMPKDPA